MSCCFPVYLIVFNFVSPERDPARSARRDRLNARRNDKASPCRGRDPALPTLARYRVTAHVTAHVIAPVSGLVPANVTASARSPAICPATARATAHATARAPLLRDRTATVKIERALTALLAAAIKFTSIRLLLSLVLSSSLRCAVLVLVKRPLLFF